MPCNRHFTSKYLNHQGQWIGTYPYLHVADPPALLAWADGDGTNRTKEIVWENIDWAKGGIYTEEDLDRMERYQDFSRTVAALESTLRERFSNMEAGSALTPYSMFLDLKVPEVPSYDLMAAMKKFLHNFGEAASIFVSPYLIINILRNVGTWVHNLIRLMDGSEVS